jgi:hypothetical protein
VDLVNKPSHGYLDRGTPQGRKEDPGHPANRSPSIVSRTWAGGVTRTVRRASTKGSQNRTLIRPDRPARLYLFKYVNDRLFEPARPSTTTVTATVVLRGPGGVTAVHCVLLTQETLVAAFEPKKKRVAVGVVSNPLPMIVSVVPPRGVPDEGEIEFNDGI